VACRSRRAALRFNEIVEPVLPQQLVQTSVERMTRGVGNSVVASHIAGCRSRVRLPIDMGEV